MHRNREGMTVGDVRMAGVRESAKRLGRWAIKHRRRHMANIEKAGGLAAATRSPVVDALALSVAATTLFEDRKTLVARWNDNKIPSPRADEVNLQGLVLDVEMSLRWANEGFPTFRLSPGLAHGLINTETISSPEWPFGAFLIRLPPGMEIEDCNGRSVSEFFYCKNMPCFEDYKDYNRLYSAIDRVIMGLSQGWDIAEDNVCVQELADKGEELDFVFAYAVEDGCVYQWYDAAHTYWHDGDPFPVSNESNTHLLTKLARNLSAYLSMRPEDWPLPKKKKSKSKKAKKKRQSERAEDERRTWSIGKEIELPEHLLRKPSNSSPEGVKRSSRKLGKRIFTQGHFRRQAIGKGWKDHKTIWVQPHYKGPEDAEVAEKRYHAKTLEEAGLTDA